MYKIIVRQVAEPKEGERYGAETDKTVVNINIPAIVAIVNDIKYIQTKWISDLSLSKES